METVRVENFTSISQKQSDWFTYIQTNRLTHMDQSTQLVRLSFTYILDILYVVSEVSLSVLQTFLQT